MNRRLVTAASFACALGIVLTLWYMRPRRDLVKNDARPWLDVVNGPLLAVSRKEANKVTLVGLDPEEHEIATIPLSCKGPFGLAFTAGRQWLYATCWYGSRVDLIDLRTQREWKTFRGARLPAWAQFRDKADEVWISNEGAGRVTIYRAGSSTILGEIATGPGPSDIVFTNSGRRAWVSNETSGNVSLLDAEQRLKIRDISVGKVPQGMALTSNGDRLLVANFGSNTVSVIDTVSSQELAQIPTCQGAVDVVTAKRDGRELGYVSCFGDGTVGVIDVERQQEIQRIRVGDKPIGIAAHPNGGRVYVCVSASNRLAVLETGRPSRVLRQITMDGSPRQIAVLP